MKSLISLVAFALPALTQTVSTAEFTNTSFAGPFTIGQAVPLMWTTGDGLPISLSLFNQTWTHTIFSGQAVLPNSYVWNVTRHKNFVSGDYQLSLKQVNGGTSNSSVFMINVPVTKGKTSGAGDTSDASDASNASKTTGSSNGTVTFTYWDDSCTCTKTTAVSTAAPVTTTTWWDASCGCHKSTAVPIATMQTMASNYTMPASHPPSTTASMTATQSSHSSTFTGEAVKLGNSVFGLMAAIAIGAVI